MPQVYAADADSQFHVSCRDWLEHQRARPDAWYASLFHEFSRAVIDHSPQLPIFNSLNFNGLLNSCLTVPFACRYLRLQLIIPAKKCICNIR